MQAGRFGLLLLGLLAGCGPTLATVSGDVTLDGQPIAKGVITFIASDSISEPLTIEIRDGKYQMRTLPGNKIVQISAPVVVRKEKEYDGPDAPLIEITEERLPARYHINTELKFEVLPGNNIKNWALDSR